MFVPLMFTGSGKLVVALLIVAFVVACFCLMLVGLGLLIAFPLTLIRPLFGKRFKWDKDLFLVSLLLTPVVFFLGMAGIELSKIFMPAIIESVERFTLFRYVALGVVVLTVSFPVSFLATRRMRRRIDILESAAKEAEKDCDFAKERKYLKVGAVLKKRKHVISIICFGVLFLIVWTTALCLGII